jgi:hypothetical protein
MDAAMGHDDAGSGSGSSGSAMDATRSLEELMEQVKQDVASQAATSLDSMGKSILAQLQATAATLEHRVEESTTGLQDQLDVLLLDSHESREEQRKSIGIEN